MVGEVFQTVITRTRWIPSEEFRPSIVLVHSAYWLLTAFIIYTLLINLIGPFIFYSLVFHVSTLILIVVKFISLKKGYSQNEVQRRCRNAVSNWLHFIATVWHGYEIYGLENCPISPCLFVFYHDSTLVDLLYFCVCYHRKFTSRNLYVIGGKRILGWNRLSKAFSISSATCSECVELLEDGNDVCILPGGGTDYSSRGNYQVDWGRRIGFATIALKANVPIVPVFTTNIQEAFRLPWFFEFCCNEVKRTFIETFGGGMPVKLKTFLGAAMHGNNSLTAYEVANRTAYSLQQCINEHQTLPASTMIALWERIFCCRNKEILEQKASLKIINA